LTLTNTNALQKTNQNLIDWNHFLKRMGELEAQKRDKISEETMHVWYRTFRMQNWTNEKFDKQFEIVLKNPSYGGVKIDEFFNEEVKYTEYEVNLKVKLAVDNLVKKGNYLLGNQIIEVTLPKIEVDLEAIRVAAAKRVELYYRNETERVTLDVIDEVLEEVKKRLNLVSKTVEV